MIFSCAYIPYLVYIFICWWISGWFLPFGNCKQCCYEHGYTNISLMSRTFKHLKPYFSPKAQTTLCLSKNLAKPDQRARKPHHSEISFKIGARDCEFSGFCTVPIVLSTWGPSSESGLLATQVVVVTGVLPRLDLTKGQWGPGYQFLPGLGLIKGLFSSHFD